MRAAARYLFANPVLFRLIETVQSDTHLGPIADPRSDGFATPTDISAFLEANRRLRDLYPYVDHMIRAFAVGAGSGRYVSMDALRAAARDNSLPQSARDAARYLVDDLAAWRSLSAAGMARGLPGFNVHDLIGRLVDGQAYANDPDEARAFTATLPVPDGGGRGLSITLCSAEGVKALANAALISANGDLTDMHQVIAHIPETTKPPATS